MAILDKWKSGDFQKSMVFEEAEFMKYLGYTHLDYDADGYTNQGVQPRVSIFLQKTCLLKGHPRGLASAPEKSIACPKRKTKNCTKLQEGTITLVFPRVL